MSILFIYSISHSVVNYRTAVYNSEFIIIVRGLIVDSPTGSINKECADKNSTFFTYRSFVLCHVLSWLLGILRNPVRCSVVHLLALA